ncbi:hypothetical protein Droror1_Dr00008693 [Drosera rotundifolia]
MSSPLLLPAAADDDKDLDDAALWAVIDSFTTTKTKTTPITTKPRKTLTLIHTTTPSSTHSTRPQFSPPLNPIHHNKTPRCEGLREDEGRERKVARSPCVSEVCESNSNGPLAVVRQVANQRSPVTVTPVRFSPKEKENVRFGVNETPRIECGGGGEKENGRHCLAGRFPTVDLFKEYQSAALGVLEKSDYTMISGNPFIKKTGWRKIAFYFNISFEIKDKSIEFDESRNVQRAEFVVRAFMQGGRFSDGWGSCERREKRFTKPNHDIPSTAETRAKNKACQDLLGIGLH